MSDNTNESIRWFRQAEFDLATAEQTLILESYEWACFQAQQSAEKALKALWFLQGYRRVMSHSVYELMVGLQKFYPITVHAKAAKKLDSVYIVARYPNGITESMIPKEFITREDAEECIHSADLILKEVRSFLSKLI